MTKNFKKDYKEWMKVKASVHSASGFRKVNEGDVVWVAIGENVGVEIDGKSVKYSRPMVVLRKHSSLCFTGVPLTSKPHCGTWYCGFRFQGRSQTAVLVQARLIDSRRVYNRIGRLSRSDYERILSGYINCVSGEKYAPVKLGSD